MENHDNMKIGNSVFSQRLTQNASIPQNVTFAYAQTLTYVCRMQPAPDTAFFSVSEEKIFQNTNPISISELPLQEVPAMSDDNGRKVNLAALQSHHTMRECSGWCKLLQSSSYLELNVENQRNVWGYSFSTALDTSTTSTLALGKNYPTCSSNSWFSGSNVHVGCSFELS